MMRRSVSHVMPSSHEPFMWSARCDHRPSSASLTTALYSDSRIIGKVINIGVGLFMKIVLEGIGDFVRMFHRGSLPKCAVMDAMLDQIVDEVPAVSR